MPFPSESFTVSGNPGAIQDAARKYASFGTTLGTGAGNVRSLDTGSWIGSEADTFREQVGKLPDPLSNAAGAFADIAAALSTFGTQLQGHQHDMDVLRPQAETAWNQMQAADDARSSHSNSLAGLIFSGDVLDEQKRNQWNSDQAKLDTAADAADAAWVSIARKAEAITEAVHQDALAAAAKINSAKDKAPHDDPWYKQVGSAVTGFGTSILDGLKGLGSDIAHGADELAGAAGDFLDNHNGGLRDLVGKGAGVLNGIGTVLDWAGGIVMGAGAAVGIVSLFAAPESGLLSLLGEVPAAGLLEIGGYGVVLGSGLHDLADWGEHKKSGKDLVVGAAENIALMATGTAVLKGVEIGIAKFGPKIADAVAPYAKKIVDKYGPRVGKTVEDLLNRLRGNKEPIARPVPSEPAPVPHEHPATPAPVPHEHPARPAPVPHEHPTPAQTAPAKPSAKKRASTRAKPPTAAEVRAMPSTPVREHKGIKIAQGYTAEPSAVRARDHEIANRLAEHTAEAVRLIDSGRLRKPPTVVATEASRGPYAARGEWIDMVAKDLAARDPQLTNKIRITPTRNRYNQPVPGPDFYDPTTKHWYDITTTGQWGRGSHRGKYQNKTFHGVDYGMGTGILYK